MDLALWMKTLSPPIVVRVFARPHVCVYVCVCVGGGGCVRARAFGVCACVCVCVWPTGNKRCAYRDIFDSWLLYVPAISKVGGCILGTNRLHSITPR